MTVEIIKTTVRYGSTKPAPYAQILCDGKEVGFITPEAVHLRLWNSVVKDGTYFKTELWAKESFDTKCANVRRFWNSIYDNYPLAVK